MKPSLRSLPAACSGLLLIACQQSPPPSADATLGTAGGSGSNLTWPSYDRPAEDYKVVVDKDVPITMSDGNVLRGDVYHPDKPGKYPVLVELTPYNKTGAVAQSYTYLQQRGYVQVTVDVRGTGSSQGTWDSFGSREQLDGPEVIEWAAQQPWSDGNIGMVGPSYMGIMQMLTAGQKPPHLRAIFPIVPMADGYRDITYSGGQINSGFIPLWLGLVTGTSLVPAVYAKDGSPQDLVLSLTSLVQHATDIGTFDVPTLANSIAGGDITYDGPYWKLHSPMELDDNIEVPAFICGGLHDLFQRGEPMHYERLKHRVTTKLLIGPWTHVTASTGKPLSGSGVGLPADGVPAYDNIMLQWFDQYLKHMNVHADELPPVTYYNYGDEKFETQADWPLPNLAPSRWYLHGDNTLDQQAPAADEAGTIQWVQQPVSGICTQSTGQWTAGAGDALPCDTDDRVNEAQEVTFTTAPVEHELRFQGPVLAHLWLSLTGPRDAVVTVRVTDVDDSTNMGASKELTAGWLAASFRATDLAKSRIVRGELLQPWHPFTRESVMDVPTDGTPFELDVEIFPTNAAIKPGHHLRIAVGPSDFPHATPPAPQLANTLTGAVTMLHDAAHPSYVTLPTLGSDCAIAGCKALPVPDMVRH